VLRVCAGPASDRNVSATRCRLCDARIDVAQAVQLVVPRGVHFFLRRDELQNDQPVAMQIVTCRYCDHLQSLDEPIIYNGQASSATYVSAPLLLARQKQAMRTFGYSAKRPGSVLEVGCGDGQFLAALAPQLDLTVGIEPSPENAARARARGVVVEQVLFGENTKVVKGPFDAFFAFHVLEHVPDVKAFLRGLRDNLIPGGVGCIEVPSSEAAFENSRYGHFMTDHLSYFFAGTLRQAIEASGFEVVALEREWDGEHLVAYVRARSARPHSPVSEWIASTTARLTAFVTDASAGGHSVAFWGASNPILPVLMHLPPDLPYIVVDKAPTKQGLHAPGSHVKILHPDELRTRKIDYVVITAPRFFAEIQTELRAAFDARVETVEADVGVAQRVCRLAWRN
jgi:SAM-dependent methyltransferase